ncbi:calcium-binding protein [Phenylobacterium sp.]|uniref:calcium-binding protein n=1 Tax=Phenylobacterium sp. TaxID=1871053 RepID=UPI0030F4AE27
MFLTGGSGKDKLTGGAGADTLYGLGGDDSLSGLAGEDVLTGGSGNDTLSGGANDDYLMGDAGNDRIDGGTGNDWAGYEDATSGVKVDLALTTAQNTLGAGIDTLVSIEYVYGSSYGDTLSGTAGANYIFGGDGDDKLYGRGGDDFLAGGAGNDTIDGGANDDTVSFDDGVAGGVVVSLITQTADGHGHDSLVSIEGVYGSGDADSIVGNDLDNYLFGGAGADTIVAAGGADYVDGDAGNDLLVGGAGDDYVLGGDGIDTFSFDDGVAGGVTVSLLNLVADGHGHDVLVAIENVIGSSYADTIAGDGGNNSISGGGGFDLLSGGGGNDVLVGGAGNDTIDGGAGIDTVSYDDGIVGGVIVMLDLQIADGHGADSLVSIENVHGSAYSDILIGSAADNYIYGGDGDDNLSAGIDGHDVLDGGAGNDWFFPDHSPDVIVAGGEGFDTINYEDGSGPDPLHGIVIDLANTGRQYVDATHSVILSSVEGVNGTHYSDTIAASTATNHFDGRGGPDVFVFRSLAELGNGASADVFSSVNDFDRIDLSAIDADTTTAGNQAFLAFTFVAGQQGATPHTDFTGRAGEIIENYIAEKDMYLVQFDVNGDRVADASLWFEHGGASDGVFIL